eukprot:scaffold417608_cov41-Prasinocladus_malaysianus.AAC.2
MSRQLTTYCTMEATLRRAVRQANKSQHAIKYSGRATNATAHFMAQSVANKRNMTGYDNILLKLE